MSQRTVPNTMDSIPISGLPELNQHLQELIDDGTIRFNVKLFDDIELQLTEDNIPPLLPSLLPPLTTILKSTTQDPTPLLTLTIKLLSPLTFTRTLTIADPPTLLTALGSPLPGANLLALAILHKAAKAPSDAAILSTLPDVVEELVRVWLQSEDTGVGERAGRVLGDLLEVDCDVITEGEGINPILQTGLITSNNNQLIKRRLPGHARLWRLILLTRPTLTIITSLCTPFPARTPNQTSISQGRLLRLLPRLSALNIRAVSHNAFPDLFPEGILQWAALEMVDKEDVLMHLNLVDFFETLASVMRVAGVSDERDEVVRRLVKAAVREDRQLEASLRSLPDRTVEEEAEDLRAYINKILA